MYYEVRSTVSGMTAVDFFSSIEKAREYAENALTFSPVSVTINIGTVEKLPPDCSVVD